MKLFRKRKADNAEEDDELLLDPDAAEEDSIRETIETPGASIDPPAETGAVPSADAILAQVGADMSAEDLTEDAPASPQPGDALDPDLLDLFREAKDEVEEATLASQLPDIPIQELLSDLENLSQSLGIASRVRAEPRPDDAPELDDEHRASRK